MADGHGLVLFGCWDRFWGLKVEDRSISSMHGREMWFWREESLAKENVAENGGKIWRNPLDRYLLHPRTPNRGEGRCNFTVVDYGTYRQQPPGACSSLLPDPEPPARD